MEAIKYLFIGDESNFIACMLFTVDNENYRTYPTEKCTLLGRKIIMTSYTNVPSEYNNRREFIRDLQVPNCGFGGSAADFYVLLREKDQQKFDFNVETTNSTSPEA